MAEYSVRERDISIARGLGHRVHLMLVNSGYKMGEDLSCSEPVSSLVPVMGNPQDSGSLHDCEFLGGRVYYTLSLVPNYGSDAEELLYVSSLLECKGWKMHSLTQGEDDKWSCTYVGKFNEYTAKGDTELEARANCICLVLNGDYWYNRYEKPEVIVYVPVSALNIEDYELPEVDDTDD